MKANRRYTGVLLTYRMILAAVVSVGSTRVSAATVVTI
jgi:hypothetical protein